MIKWVGQLPCCAPEIFRVETSETETSVAGCINREFTYQKRNGRLNAAHANDGIGY